MNCIYCNKELIEVYEHYYECFCANELNSKIIVSYFMYNNTIREIYLKEIKEKIYNKVCSFKLFA